MAVYILRRVIYTIPIAIGVSIVCFLLIHLAPGDPLSAVMPGGRLARDHRSNPRGLRLRPAAAGPVPEVAGPCGDRRFRHVDHDAPPGAG